VWKSIGRQGSPVLAGDCCFSIKLVRTRYIEYTTSGSQALSLLTELLSVSTKKERKNILTARMQNVFGT